jgi:hypothetical protein
VPIVIFKVITKMILRERSLDESTTFESKFGAGLLASLLCRHHVLSYDVLSQ